MQTNLATQSAQTQAIIEKVVIRGDLSLLNPAQKVQYYNEFCKSLGLNPLTQPFQLITFQGKERLYATKDCTEQLRKIHGVSIIESDTKNVGDVYIVTVKAQDKHGRTDVATGAVTAKGLSADALANAFMKAETKAKRRVTLSICGLGILDESETDTIGNFRVSAIPKLTPEEIKKEDEEWNAIDKLNKKEDHIEEKTDDVVTAEEVEEALEQDPNHCSFEGCGKSIISKVSDYSIKQYGVPLCYPHQKNV
jgi:hypothetical protein